MTTKDRTALLQYWVAVSKRNVGFRDWLTIQLHSIDGPQVATAFEQLTTGALDTCASDACATEEEDNWKTSTDKISTRHCIAIVLCLLVGIALIVLSLTVYLPDYLSTPVPPPNATSRILVAEDVTTIVGTYPSSVSSSLLVSEVVKRGDDFHTCYILIVPSSTLSYHQRTQNESVNSTTIIDGYPVINYRYVYMIKGSSLSVRACLGNVSRSPNAVLYVFNNESQYADYVKYSVSDTAVYSALLKVGGLGESECTTVSFTAPSSDYYYFIMLLPVQGTRYSYFMLETEKYINYKDYLYDYSYCIVARGHNCSMSLVANSTRDGNQAGTNDEVTVLAYVQPNYSIGSKLNHLDVMFGSYEEGERDKSFFICWCLFVMGVLVLLMSFLSFALWACFCFRRNRRRSGISYKSRTTVN